MRRGSGCRANRGLKARRSGVLVLLAAVGACAQPGTDTDEVVPTDGVVLFDCAGRIQRIDVGEVVETASVRYVSDLDPTLPERVVDGCATHAGWYDEDTGDLHLAVQTEALTGADDGLSVKILRIAPTLDSAVELADAWTSGPTGETASETTEETAASVLRRLPRADVATVLAGLETVDGPFARSVGYPSGDGSTILLQEIADGTDDEPEGRPDGPGGVRVAPMWRVGDVSLRRARPDATGRYALMSVETGELVGEVVTSTDGPDANRVICFTAEGRIHLAADDGVLHVLDAAHPDYRGKISDLELDLSWSGCAFVPGGHGGPSSEQPGTEP